MNSLKLKIFAIIVMTIDHLGIVFNAIHNYRSVGDDFVYFSNDAYWYMRVIGRMAFPVFCFMIAEGCAHTKSMGKYILRLAVFALISQIPFQVFGTIRYGLGYFNENWYVFSKSNVIVTLTLGALVVFFYSKSYERGWFKKLLCYIGIIAAFFAVIILKSEYDIYGLSVILLVYIFRSKDKNAPDEAIFGNSYMQVFVCTAVTFVFYFIVYNHMNMTYQVLGAVLSAVPLLLYNSKPGKYRAKMLFYIYYPAHFLVLSAVLFVVLQ